jgi:hypothetical protein
MRTHISLPKELVDEIDAVAGPRKRSEFIEEAIKLKLVNARQRRALESPGPGLDPQDYPHWATPELASRWVHDTRQADQAYVDTRLAKQEPQRTSGREAN